ncbi:unnamed protein product [Rhizophagus irregularis]|nr:unnamed protein product [Rhizophagus irregularis]
MARGKDKEWLQLLREVDCHPRINRCLGITKDSKNYILVLEYANEGNLRKYLKKNFTSLKWTDKIQMALDITSGLKFLHSKGIIHRDLHSKNILGEREDLIEGTPLKYQQLYQECWDDNPESRPDIEKVHEILSQLCNEDSFDLQSSRILSNSDYSMEYIENNYRGGMLTFL